MTFKSSEKSFFEEAIEEKKKDLEQLEKKGVKKGLRLYDFGTSKLREEMKKHPAQYFFLFASTLFGSIVTTTVGLFVFSSNILVFFKNEPPQKEAISVERTVDQKEGELKYDSLLLASKLRSGDKNIEIIDIRSPQDFKKGHILGAINIPVYETTLVNEDGGIEPQLVKDAFDEFMRSENLLIIYAQNSYSTLPGEIAALLTSEDKTVKALAVGYDEWAHLQGN